MVRIVSTRLTQVDDALPSTSLRGEGFASVVRSRVDGVL